MPIPRTPEGMDRLLGRLDLCLACVENPPASEVGVQKAKLELLSNLEEARNIMHEVMRNPSDRALLAQVFGGDCSRIARLQVICESAQQSELVAGDTRLKDCFNVCHSMEQVITDLGLKDALDKALASERRAVQDDDDDGESDEFVCLVAKASVAEAEAVDLEQVGDIEGAINKYAECVLNLTEAVSAAPPDSADAVRLAKHCGQIGDRIEYLTALSTGTEEIEVEVRHRKSMDTDSKKSLLVKESEALVADSVDTAKLPVETHVTGIPVDTVAKAALTSETLVKTHVTGIPVDTAANAALRSRVGDPYTNTQSLPLAPASVSCAKGCGRPAFQKYPTCCTHCKGPEGPHAFDCARKVAMAPPPVSVEEQIHPLNLDMHKNKKKKKKFIRACAAIGCTGGAVMLAPATAVAVGLGASAATGYVVVAGAAVAGGAVGSHAARRDDFLGQGVRAAGKPVHSAAKKSLKGATRVLEESGVTGAVTDVGDRLRAKTMEIDAQYAVSEKILEASKQAAASLGTVDEKYEVSKRLEQVSKTVADRLGKVAEKK